MSGKNSVGFVLVSVGSLPGWYNDSCDHNLEERIDEIIRRRLNVGFYDIDDGIDVEYQHDGLSNYTAYNNNGDIIEQSTIDLNEAIQYAYENMI